MEVIYLNKQSEFDLEDSCVALGFFDGMHLGHLKLVEKVISICNKTGLKKGLLTFDVQPKAYLSNQHFKQLMSLEDKIDFMKKYDFDYLFVLSFSNKLASMEPDKFIDEYLIKTKIKHVVCGFDFHFGNQGKGDCNFLIKYKENNYEVSVIDKLEYEHHKISSSFLREILSQGEVELATKLLNRPYQVSGLIIHGRKNGHKIGFPTINVDANNYVLPKGGVYASKVIIDGKEYLGMANLGYNPTFTALKQISLEVNIFDFDQDVYGKMAKVIFLKRIRKEQKFPSIDDLIEQLKADKQKIIDEFS